MKQLGDDRTMELLLQRKAGRPREYMSNAERQAAYRVRLAASRVHRVAVLFARADSVYKGFPDCDVWDAERDARRWPGGLPVIAHPPCRAWGRLRQFANPRPDERELAHFAVAQVRRFGGVLEHPIGSTLWPAAELPLPGEFDAFGGWTLPVKQSWFGHLAEKSTWLYIVGLRPGELPAAAVDLSPAQYVVGTSGRRKDGSRAASRPCISKADREHSPIAFAAWLRELALGCGALRES